MMTSLEPEKKADETASSYEVKTNCTELTILTKDKTLYYTRYTLAKKSEYFNKKFNGQLGDATDNTIDMKMYSSDIVIDVLTMLDDETQLTKLYDECLKYDVLKLVNYYQFTNIMNRLLPLIDKYYHSMRMANVLAGDEFINGVYGKEVRETLTKIVEYYIDKVIKMNMKTDILFDEIDKMEDVNKYLETLIRNTLYLRACKKI